MIAANSKKSFPGEACCPFHQATVSPNRELVDRFFIAMVLPVRLRRLPVCNLHIYPVGEACLGAVGQCSRHFDALTSRVVHICGNVLAVLRI